MGGGWAPVIAALVVNIGWALIQWGAFGNRMKNAEKRLELGDSKFKEHDDRLGDLDVNMARVKLKVGLNGDAHHII
jgi:hypothetical protein